MVTANSDLAIQSIGLGKSFGQFRAVDGIDLAVPAGSVYAVLGPNGAGKTTLVRMISTLLRPDEGVAKVFGYDVVQDATAVRSLIGLTGQYASVDEDMTARENLVIFGKLLGKSKVRAQETAAELLADFGLDDAADRLLKNFSGGMRRRLDLAASLVASPPLLFLDEPTTGLDPRTRAQLWDRLRTLVAQGTTILLTTQYLEEADLLADRIAVVDKGRLVAEGTADELKATIGDRLLELTLSDPALVATAAVVISRLCSGNAVVSESGTVAAPLDDLESLPELLLALRADGIGITDINVKKPSLDEVFFAITGHAKREVPA